MKVKELIKELQYANPNAEIEFCSPSGQQQLLSIYSPTGPLNPDSDINNKSRRLCIDLDEVLV